MKIFIKYFVLGIISQVLLVILIILTGLGDLILLPYTIPYEILGAIVTLPKQIGSENSIMIPIVLLCIPAVFYSIIFALIMYVVKRTKKST